MDQARTRKVRKEDTVVDVLDETIVRPPFWFLFSTLPDWDAWKEETLSRCPVPKRVGLTLDQGFERNSSCSFLNRDLKSDVLHEYMDDHRLCDAFLHAHRPGRRGPVKWDGRFFCAPCCDAPLKPKKEGLRLFGRVLGVFQRGGGKPSRNRGPVNSFGT